MNDMNDKLKIDIQRVLQVFTQNESGNKVTQFNMMGLTNMILGVIDGTVVIRQQAGPQGQPTARPVPIETHRVDLPKPKKVENELPKPKVELPKPKKAEDALDMSENKEILKPVADEQPKYLEPNPEELGELSEKPIVTKV